MSLLPPTLRSAALDRFGWLYVSYLTRKANSLNMDSVETQLRSPTAPDHVLIIVLDACRPDVDLALPLTFTTAVAPAPWTFPSVTSLHTGLYPHEHGAVFRHKREHEGSVLFPDQYANRPILTEIMTAAGYQTYGGFGFLIPFRAAKGWYQTHDLGRETAASDLISSYRKWRKNREHSFAYLHFQDLHAPLKPPAKYAERKDVLDPDQSVRRIEMTRSDFDHVDEFLDFRDQRSRLYRATVEYLSDTLGPFIESLKEDTLVVLTADHGEAHWEHMEQDKRFKHDKDPKFGYGHGETPFDKVARVPLAVHSPEGLFSTPTDGGWPSLCDVPATIIDAVTPISFPKGHSWKKPIPESRTVFCEGARFGEERKAAYQGRYKVIHGQSSDVTLTAEVDRKDNGERFTEIPESIRQDLLEQLPDDLDMSGGETTNPSIFVKDQLEHLGYR